MVKRFLCIVLTLLLLLLLFCGCGGGDGDLKRRAKKEPAAGITVYQVTPSLLALPLYAAIEEGFFAKENLRVTVETTWSRDKALEALLNNTATIPILLDSPETLLYLTQQENKDGLISFAQTACATGFFLLARENQKPFTWQDLKGKVVIAYRDGELPEVIFEFILKNNGLKPHQNVHLIQNLPYQAYQGVFLAGTGHYILAAEPAASQMEKENGSIVVASLETSAGPLVSSVCITTGDYLASKRENCEKFVRALAEGLLWLDERSPEEITAIAGKYFSQEEGILLRAVSRYKTLGVWPLTPRVDSDGLKRLQEIMLQESELNSLIPPDMLINNILQE